MQYVIDISDSGSQGSDGSVALNGVVLLAPRVSGEIGPRHVRRSVVLGAQNELTVRATGKVGSGVRVFVARQPRIDGSIETGEWQRAATYPFLANLPAGGTTPATLYVINDDRNLYLGVAFLRGSIDTGGNLLGFEFDANNNGVGPEVGDDYFGYSYSPFNVFSDAFRSACPGGAPSVCVTNDRPDGTGAFANANGVSAYEIVHPLNSGELGYDFALSAGQTIGLFLQLNIGGTATTFPGQFIQYQPIVITGPVQ